MDAQGFWRIMRWENNMDYQIYNFLVGQIENAIQKAHENYVTAVSQYPTRGLSKKQLAAKAINDELCWQAYRKEESSLRKGLEDLRESIKSYQKEHNPTNKGLLEFWCVDQKDIDKLAKKCKVKNKQQKRIKQK